MICCRSANPSDDVVESRSRVCDGLPLATGSGSESERVVGGMAKYWACLSFADWEGLPLMQGVEDHHEPD